MYINDCLAEECCQNYRYNSNQEYAIENACTTNRYNTRICAPYFPDIQEITMDMRTMKEVSIQYDAKAEAKTADHSLPLKITIEPLSAVMVSYSK